MYQYTIYIKEILGIGGGEKVWILKATQTDELQR